MNLLLVIVPKMEEAIDENKLKEILGDDIQGKSFQLKQSFYFYDGSLAVYAFMMIVLKIACR